VEPFDEAPDPFLIFGRDPNPIVFDPEADPAARHALPANPDLGV
jgi:hypothetical protein